MFIWVGCKLPEDFENALRQDCLQVNREVGLNTVAFDLPQHISLKISFPTEEPEAVLAYLKDYLARQKPFSVKFLPPESIPGVLWLPVAENPMLRQLHRELDAQLEQRFAIVQHPLDKTFLFHSTLFLDADREKLRRMEEKLQTLPLPDSLWVDTFLLGVSPDGKPGNCQIVDSVSTT